MPVTGFTFIELLLVILFIGALAAISIPRFKRSFSGLQLDNFAKDIYYLSRYLQATSGAQGKIYSLSISPDQHEFRAAYEEGGQFQPVPGTYGRAYKFPPEANVLTEPPAISEIYFYPDASMDKSLNITFSNPYDKKITLVIKGAAGAIEIK